MKLLSIAMLLSVLLVGPFGCGDDLERVSDDPPVQNPPTPPATGAGSGELIIYWQETGMGEVAENLDRWISSVRTADGKPARREDAIIAERAINGLKVTTLDISGDLGGGEMGTAHASGATEGRRLLCAIAEVPGSVPYYIKASGSVATMKGAQVGWEAFLTSLRIGDDGKLTFQLPAGWTRGKPTSAMRYAQATIPGAD